MPAIDADLPDEPSDAVVIPTWGALGGAGRPDDGVTPEARRWAPPAASSTTTRVWTPPCVMGDPASSA